ncbi:MAG: S8 family peptidase [Pseudonocardiaceae bacterium]
MDNSDDPDRQIVIATEHLRLVLGELGDQADVLKDDARLGLTLIQLPDLRAAADRLEAERCKAFESASVPETSTDLDRVLANLRVLIEQRYNGWTPPMGKNRTMTGLQFKPYASAGGFAEPTPAKPLAEFEALPRAHRRVRVGLLDTRLDQHSWLSGRYLADPDALVKSSPDEDPAFGEGRLWWEGHATFIAGMVLAQAPAADLDVRTALRRERGTASGHSWTMPVWEFAGRLADYRDSGVSVLNLSLGCSTNDGKPPMVLERAIAQLTPNIAVIAAAGNHGTATLDPQTRTRHGMPEPTAALFPAALDGVLAVGALDADVPAEFNPRNGANESEPAPWIDVFAQGVNVTSTYLGESGGEQVRIPAEDGGQDKVVWFDGWAAWTGTSFAAGEITGAVAAEIATGKTPQEAVETVRNAYRRR